MKYKIPQTVSDSEYLKIDYIPKAKSLILPMIYQVKTKLLHYSHR